MTYTHRLDEALALAASAFRGSLRKGTRIPYLTHLLQVAVWVGEHGGDEDQMIAAVLHDYLEDVHGATAEDLDARFGERVARLVQDLSDSTSHPKPPWRERKQRYVAALALKPAELKLISTADKLHNARCILRDLDTVGPEVFDRFSAPRAEVLWYYRAVTAALGTGWSHPLLAELEATVAELHAR